MSLKKNLIWNIFGMAAPMGVAFFSIPILIDGLGKEFFGILTLVWLIIGYLSFLELGIGRSITSQISFFKNVNDKKIVGEIIGTGYCITFVTGCLGALILSFNTELIINRLLHVSVEYHNEAVEAFFLASLGIPATVISSVAIGTLEGYEQFKITNKIKFAQGVLNFLIPLLIVELFSAGIVEVVLSLVFFRYVFLLIAILCLNLISKNVIYKWSKNRALSLLSFGSWVTVSNVVGSLMVNSDRFFIASIVGVSSVLYYSVPLDALSKILVVATAISGVLFPRFIALSENKKELLFLLRKTLIVSLIVFVAPTIILFIYLPIGIEYWLGSDFSEKSSYLSRVILCGVFVNSIAQILFAYVQSFGEAKSTAILHVAEFILYCPFLIWAIKVYGLVGAAYVWSIRACVDALMLSILAVLKTKNIGEN